MAKDWNAIIEFDRSYETCASEEFADDLVEWFIHYHPAVGESDNGNYRVTITLPADSFFQACRTVIALIDDSKLPDVRSMELLPTTDFDKRNGLAPMPEIIGVSEAAKELGITRQRITQLISQHKLRATKAGNNWVIARHDLDMFVSNREHN